jgi:hypothetical protein
MRLLTEVETRLRRMIPSEHSYFKLEKKHLLEIDLECFHNGVCFKARLSSQRFARWYVARWEHLYNKDLEIIRDFLVQNHLTKESKTHSVIKQRT